MNLKELKDHFFKRLGDVYPVEEIQSFFYILCDSLLKYSRFEVSLNANTNIDSSIEVQFSNITERLLKQEPIQYILGETEFYGHTFKVNKYTLIPRPETEELVDWIIFQHKHLDSNLKILDIGTGSGCIPISIAKELKQAKIYAVDISEGALKVAIQNAQYNNVEVSFKQVDILQTKSLETEYDIIISNPPYVRELEKNEMKPNVLDYEPETALFVSNENPLMFYEKIAKLSLENLKAGGWLYFEINEYLPEEMENLLKDLGFLEIELKKDFRQVPRMIRCKRG